jgi:hypothetical protein
VIWPFLFLDNNFLQPGVEEASSCPQMSWYYAACFILIIFFLFNYFHLGMHDFFPIHVFLWAGGNYCSVSLSLFICVDFFYLFICPFLGVWNCATAAWCSLWILLWGMCNLGTLRKYSHVKLKRVMNSLMIQS